MKNKERFLDVDFLNSQAIPGESLTQEPKLRPYEKPPQITRPDEALAYLIQSTSEPSVKRKILDTIDAGLSVETIVSGLLLNNFSEGVFNPDVAEIIKIPAIQYITEQAYDAGIEDISVGNAPIDSDMEVEDKAEMMKSFNPRKFNRIMNQPLPDDIPVLQEDNEDVLFEQDIVDEEPSQGFIEQKGIA